MKMLTSWTSDFPILSTFEISQVPPVEAESTPAVPRAWRPIFARTALKSERAENFGTLTMQPARRPVPKLDGQVNTHPKCSLCMKSWPEFKKLWGLRSIDVFGKSKNSKDGGFGNSKFSKNRAFDESRFSVNRNSGVIKGFGESRFAVNRRFSKSRGIRWIEIFDKLRFVEKRNFRDLRRSGIRWIEVQG